MRKMLGEIPKVPAALSFFDILTRDSKTGAKVLKNPEQLKSLFENLPGMKFDELNDDNDDVEKSLSRAQIFGAAESNAPR